MSRKTTWSTSGFRNLLIWDHPPACLEEITSFITKSTWFVQTLPLPSPLNSPFLEFRLIPCLHVCGATLYTSKILPVYKQQSKILRLQSISSVQTSPPPNYNASPSKALPVYKRNDSHQVHLALASQQWLAWSQRGRTESSTKVFHGKDLNANIEKFGRWRIFPWVQPLHITGWGPGKFVMAIMILMMDFTKMSVTTKLLVL